MPTSQRRRRLVTTTILAVLTAGALAAGTATAGAAPATAPAGRCGPSPSRTRGMPRWHALLKNSTRHAGCRLRRTGSA